MPIKKWWKEKLAATNIIISEKKTQFAKYNSTPKFFDLQYPGTYVSCYCKSPRSSP